MMDKKEEKAIQISKDNIALVRMTIISFGKPVQLGRDKQEKGNKHISR